MKRCPKCGATLNDDDNFCLFCGASLESDGSAFETNSSNVCPYCKAPINKGDVFCTNCGMELKDDGTVRKNESIYSNNNNEQETFFTPFKKFFKNLFNFKGVTNSKDYWTPRIVLYIIFTLVSNIIPEDLIQYKFPVTEDNSLIFATIFEMDALGENFIVPILSLALDFLFELIFIPIMVRRIRDTGKSPWYFFVQFIPLIGTIWLFIILIQPTNKYINRH